MQPFGTSATKVAEVVTLGSVTVTASDFIPIEEGIADLGAGPLTVFGGMLMLGGDQNSNAKAPDSGDDSKSKDKTPAKPDKPGTTTPTPAPTKPVPPIPADPTQPPAPGWTWQGPDPPGGARGGWVSPDGTESLHPDPNHPFPEGPHWDWNDPDGNQWRIPPDGPPKPK